MHLLRRLLRSRYRVGIALQDDGIYLAKSMRSKVAEYFYAKLPLGVIQEGKIVQYHSVVNALIELVQQTAVENMQVAMILHPAQVYTRSVTIPAEVESRFLAEEIWHAAAGHMLGPKENFCMDYSPFQSSNTVTLHQTWQLYAARSEIVTTFMKLAKEARLKLCYLRVEYHVIARAIHHFQPYANKVIAVVNCLSSPYYFFVMQGENLLFEYCFKLNEKNAAEDNQLSSLHAWQLWVTTHGYLPIEKLYMLTDSQSSFAAWISERLSAYVATIEYWQADSFSDVMPQYLSVLGAILGKNTAW